jgi:hypothetical protein
MGSSKAILSAIFTSRSPDGRAGPQVTFLADRSLQPLCSEARCTHRTRETNQRDFSSKPAMP